MLNVIILTLEFSIAGKCFFLGSFIWRFSCDFLTFFGGEVNWRGVRTDQLSDSGSEDLKAGLCCVLAGGWPAECIGGIAGAALCVEDVAVLRDEKGISSAA